MVYNYGSFILFHGLMVIKTFSCVLFLQHKGKKNELAIQGRQLISLAEVNHSYC